ncbi:MAG TPA: PDZ domain-containing protein [Miltoncostaeaceae bacterium]|nr:PDZ domain-containing protein [Miltoncostaeaceae bacterium]
MPRLGTCVAAIAACAIGAGTAVAQQPTPAAPTTPTTPANPAPAAGPPKLSSLRLPAVVSAQQGHARFLVGIRLSVPAKLTVQVLSSAGKVVQAKTDATARKAGRAYIRVEAVDTRGFQLLQGAYTLRIQAADDQGRTSPAVEGPFRLRLTTPRGLFDAYTVPLWRAFQRQVGTTTPGQLVAVVGPKGVVATAGLRRGDVITSLNGTAVAQPGAWQTALRGLPAEKAVEIQYLRKGQAVTASLQPKPDWEAAPDYAKSLAVAVKRDPRVLAYAVAQVRQLIDAAKLADAKGLIDEWPAAWRTSAPGQLVQGDLEAKAGRWKQALGAYNRARKKDATLAAAEFGRGLALSELKKTNPSIVAFGAAATLDPTDASAFGFRAYALLQAGRDADAVVAARQAVALDSRYADAFLPFGIALIATGDKPAGVKALRRGLVLLEEPDRADQLITQHLDPTDP